jgi:hypothetical protein
LPSELTVTWPLAFDKQCAPAAAAERTSSKLVFWADAVRLARLSARPITTERLLFFILMFFLFLVLVLFLPRGAFLFSQ